MPQIFSTNSTAMATVGSRLTRSGHLVKNTARRLVMRAASHGKAGRRLAMAKAAETCSDRRVCAAMAGSPNTPAATEIVDLTAVRMVVMRVRGRSATEGRRHPAVRVGRGGRVRRVRRLKNRRAIRGSRMPDNLRSVSRVLISVAIGAPLRGPAECAAMTRHRAGLSRWAHAWMFVAAADSRPCATGVPDGNSATIWAPAGRKAHRAISVRRCRPVAVLIVNHRRAWSVRIVSQCPPVRTDRPRCGAPKEHATASRSRSRGESGMAARKVRGDVMCSKAKRG